MRASSTSATATASRTNKSRVARVADAALAHPVLFVFVLALAVRVFIAVVLTKYFSGTLVLDDTTYHAMAYQMAEGAAGAWDDYTYQLYWSTATFMVPITWLYRLFGASPIVGQLFVVLMGTVTAAFVVRLALEFVTPRWAIVAGVIVALLPSQAFWSSMLMKDASVWLVLSGLGLTVAVGLRAVGKQLVWLGLAAATFLFMLSYLRLHTLVVAAWALMIASFFGIKQDRVPRISGALLIALVVPWLFGAIGPAGLSLVLDHGSLEERRFFNAQGAKTAIVPTEQASAGEGVAVSELEAQAEALEEQAREIQSTDPSSAEELLVAAEKVRERVQSTGAAPVPQLPGDGGGAIDPNLKHLPRGISVMLVEPLPIPLTGSVSLKLARLESLLWYPLLVMALVGLWNVRPYLQKMAFALLVGGGIVIMYALSEGNLGTAHRHRGEFVWVIALLAMIGARRLYERREHRAGPSHPSTTRS